MAAFGADVAATLEAWDVDNAILIGHSMSGAVITEAALAAPDRVLGLIGVDNFQSVNMKINEQQIGGFVSAFDRDFITATEVVEHLQTPAATLDRLWACLAPGGLLAIMTQLRPDRAAFDHWHYKHDVTHVAFFTIATFRWLGTRLGATVAFPSADVILLHKQSEPPT